MEKDSKKEQKNMTAVISYIGVLCLVPILMQEKNEFVKFHAKQGLVLFIAEVATGMIAGIPILGWIAGSLAWGLWGIFSFIGIMNVLNGKRVPLPVIGGFAKNFKF